MSDVNHVIEIGRLTKDAEAKGDSGPVRFCIAVNRRVKKGEEWLDEASFFDVEYWHRGILSHLVKGKQIAVIGELKQDRWTDNEGAARSKVVISAQNIQLLGGGNAQGSGGAKEETIPF